MLLLDGKSNINQPNVVWLQGKKGMRINDIAAICDVPAAQVVLLGQEPWHYFSSVMLMVVRPAPVRELGTSNAAIWNVNKLS